MDRGDQIRSFFTRLSAETPLDELNAFIAEGKPLEVSAGEYFCAPGERNHRVGFLHQGSVRFHVLTESGDDVTKDFSFAGSFVVSFGSAVRGQPAAVAVSAVEDCDFTVWPYARLQR